MDLTQIGLGLVLLGLGSLTLVGSTLFDSNAAGYAIGTAGVFVAAAALLVTVARNCSSRRVRFRS